MNDISAAGFVNIQAKTIEDLVTGWLTKDGEVEEVTIDGDGSFRAGDTFDKTVAIIVSYHTFPSKNEEVTTDSAGHSETSTPPENYSTETEKWLASSEYADCVADGKFPAVPGNNPYGSGVNESSRNPNIYYLNSSMRGPWGKETEYGDYEYYIPQLIYIPGNYKSVYWYELMGQQLGWKSCGTQALYRPGGRTEPRTSPSIFMCPSGIWSDLKDEFFYGTISYRSNVPRVKMDETQNLDSNRGARVQQVRKPASRLFLYDSGSNDFYLPGTGKTPGCTTNPSHVYVSPYLNDFYNGRHVRSINGVFFDGHVENIASDTAWRHRALGGNSTASVFNIFK